MLFIKKVMKWIKTCRNQASLKQVCFFDDGGFFDIKNGLGGEMEAKLQTKPTGFNRNKISCLGISSDSELFGSKSEISKTVNTVFYVDRDGGAHSYSQKGSKI